MWSAYCSPKLFHQDPWCSFLEEFSRPLWKCGVQGTHLRTLFPADPWPGCTVSKVDTRTSWCRFRRWSQCRPALPPHRGWCRRQLRCGLSNPTSRRWTWHKCALRQSPKPFGRCWSETVTSLHWSNDKKYKVYYLYVYVTLNLQFFWQRRFLLRKRRFSTWRSRRVWVWKSPLQPKNEFVKMEPISINS